MLQFEFHVYSGDEFGAISETAEHLYLPLASDAAAKSKAGSLCKRFNGPVDLARAGTDEWNVRYITTASPSEFHASGYRLERLR